MLHAADEELRGRVLPLGDKLCIGRRADPAVDFVVDDKLLSGRHATIARVERGYEIVDHHSRNGSFVDGERVEQARLSDGAIIRLGVNLFELTRDPPAAAPLDATSEGDATGALVGTSFALKKALEAIERLAQEPGPVLLVGEHGTGKEAAARRLHQLAGRSGQFFSADCNALPAAVAGTQLFGDAGGGGDLVGRGMEDTLVVADDLGLWARADGGTLLLDAIDALDTVAQERLARLLSFTPAEGDQRFEVALVATTEVDLDALVDDGSFSRELYRQLEPRTLEMPPLRARRCDIPRLARHFWHTLAPGRALDFSATCLEKLLLYDWPMNIRELRALMQRLSTAEGDLSTVRSAHLPSEIRDRGAHTMDQLRASGIMVQVAPSRDDLAMLLQRFDGNIVKLAQFYARDKRQVYKWLKRHDLKISDYRKGKA